MKKGVLILFVIFLMVSCSNKKIPDVSHIQVDLSVQRFENDFFTIDTTNTDVALQKLHEKYPSFLQDFIFNILALSPKPEDAQSVEAGIRSFIRTYKPLKDSVDIIYSDFSKTRDEIKRGLQFVKYYFPKYPVPNNVITFIGPLDSYGNILTANALGVGLQMYMGSNYSLYQSEMGQQLYPLYISRRFSKEYIPVNCIKNIVDDIFPNNSAGMPLIDQMIQAGKKLYLLDQFMPEVPDTLKTGYTKAQLEGAYANEELIWSVFVQNDMLYKTDPSIIKDYMNDGPNTPVLGQSSPGFIGQFVGWQIVKKWMEKTEGITLQKLIDTNPHIIFEESKYKPR